METIQVDREQGLYTPFVWVAPAPPFQLASIDVFCSSVYWLFYIIKMYYT